MTIDWKLWRSIGLPLLTLSLAGAPAGSSAAVAAAKQSKASQARIQAAYGKLPLQFEANRGQTDPRVKFLSRGSGYTLFLTPTEAVLTMCPRCKVISVREELGQGDK